MMGFGGSKSALPVGPEPCAACGGISTAERRESQGAGRARDYASSPEDEADGERADSPGLKSPSGFGIVAYRRQWREQAGGDWKPQGAPAARLCGFPGSAAQRIPLIKHFAK